MRIGKFAEKHDVTQDTIRYYLEKGLLVTKKKGDQYRFSKADSNDLEKIRELKNLGFSLTEIQTILTFQRLSGANTDVSRNLYLSLLEEKEKEIAAKLLKYNKLDTFIKDKIENLKAEKLKHSEKLGFPIKALEVLICPVCKGSLGLSNGVIEQNMITDAGIQCQCGYTATIKDGIYIDETAVRTKTLNGQPMPTKEEYLAKASYTYVNFLYQGMATLNEYVDEYPKEPKYIMELSNCVGFFLLQHIKNLAPNSVYILIDYDKERITQLKKNLEMYYKHKNFIFLCCDFHKLPIAQSTIDMMVDFGLTKPYAESTGEFLPEKLLPLLKENGSLVASYLYAGRNPKNNSKPANPTAIYPNRDEIIQKLISTNLTTVEIIDIGPALNDSPYSLNPKNVELYQLAYSGKKVMTIG